MPATLEGTPRRYGDAGFFACTRADLEPYDLYEERAPAEPPPRPRPGVWLVLTLCPRCNRLHSYCSQHRITR